MGTDRDPKAKAPSSFAPLDLPLIPGPLMPEVCGTTPVRFDLVRTPGKDPLWEADEIINRRKHFYSLAGAVRAFTQVLLSGYVKPRHRPALHKAITSTAIRAALTSTDTTLPVYLVVSVNEEAPEGAQVLVSHHDTAGGPMVINAGLILNLSLVAALVRTKVEEFAKAGRLRVLEVPEGRFAELKRATEEIESRMLPLEAIREEVDRLKQEMAKLKKTAGESVAERQRQIINRLRQLDKALDERLAGARS